MSERERDEHPAIKAQRHLAEIATMYPDLVYGLGRNGNSASERISGSKERPLPIRTEVSDALTAVHEFAMYLADRVYWESHENLAQLLDDDIIAEVSRRFIGVFASNDDLEAREFVKECKGLAGRIRSVAYPHGARLIDVPNRVDDNASRRDPMQCVEPGCAGNYQMRIDPNGRWFVNVADPASWPPLTCKADNRHIVTGVELARSIAWAKMNGTTCSEELRAWRAA
jgi:hypothetical protein